MPAVWTDVGQAQAVDLLDPATRSGISATYHIHWGSGVTAPAVTQTALVTALAEARVAATVTQPAANQVQYVGTITATAARTVNEAAVFDASTAGNMIIRGTHSTLNIETGDRVEYTFTNTLKDSSE